ncbi:hypothetical protein [Xanthomarina sp. F2636L]|uniref:hypothetical protein n=1 Tax=Xanthomarina sp. F2636L TaxID=2996018 RepID=UPI00225DF5C7|nr:hypothetical protein [Xanthomarina sp. F2636L]MCX7552136.1 hypothetical protein [Xanthomarina sp. F2636L]
MKNLLGIFTLILLTFSCSSDDNSNNGDEVLDTRYKLIFESDGSGAIIGDNSNTVIKRLFTYGYHVTHDFYFNETTNNFYFSSFSNTSNDIVFHKANVLEALNSEEYHYPTEELPILISDQEHLEKVVIDNNENIYLVLEDSPNPSFENIYYRKIVSNQVVENINLTANFGIFGYLDFFYLDIPNKLVILDEETNQVNGVIIDLETNSMTQITLPSNFNVSNIISSNSDIYFISNNGIYDIQGNHISTLSDSIGGSAIGYDLEDSRFEYIYRGDGRNEAGIINIQTGESDKSSINGEPGFHSSNLFFFNN